MNNFLQSTANKRDLTSVLSEYLAETVVDENQELVIDGGFFEKDRAVSSVREDLDILSANHTCNYAASCGWSL